MTMLLPLLLASASPAAATAPFLVCITRAAALARLRGARSSHPARRADGGCFPLAPSWRIVSSDERGAVSLVTVRSRRGTVRRFWSPERIGDD